MGRVTTDELVGYAMGIQVGEEQAVDPKDGMPLFNGDGSPKMRPSWRFVFNAANPNTGDSHIVIFTLTEEAKQKVVEALTGGVVVPSIQLPQGVSL